jgi:hypothetical protein
MAPKVKEPALIVDDLGSGAPGDDFAARYAAQGLAALAEYLAKWAAFRDLTGDE